MGDGPKKAEIMQLLKQKEQDYLDLLAKHMKLVFKMELIEKLLKED